MNSFEKKMDNILSESVRKTSNSLNEESESFYKKKGLNPDDFASALEGALAKLNKEELGDLTSWKQFEKIMLYIEKDRFVPSKQVDKLKSLPQKNQMDFLQFAQMYI